MPPPLGTTGLVYYALDASRLAFYLKIGFTTNLAQRISALRATTTSGQVPLVIGLEEGDVEVERARHVEFCDLRSHGEWFRYEVTLQAHVATLEHPFSFVLDRPRVWQYAHGWGPIGTAASTIRPPLSDREPYHVAEDDEVPYDPREPVDF